MHARPSRTALSPIAIAVVAALAAAPAARAQEDAAGLEEIVVTAQKREQKLQEVPIAVSVVGEDLLRGVTGLTVAREPVWLFGAYAFRITRRTSRAKSIHSFW